MRKIGRVVTIILVIAIVLGTICAGVGTLTGADIGRVTAVLENRVETRYNVAAQAFVNIWIPEVVQTFRQALA